MKKLFVSMGLAAAGAASVHAIPSDSSKIWSLSGTLRGFYDDNYNTTPVKQGSAGFEVNPSFSLHMPLQQTEIGLQYSYGLYFYQQRESNGQNPIDQTHQLDVYLDHAFTPNWEGRLEDTFTISQDPQLSGVGTATPQRLNGNNIANTVRASLNTDWTRQFSTALTFSDSYYNYDQGGGMVTGAPGFETVATSYAGTLNRFENLISLDLQWHVSPVTMALIGFQYGQVNFVGNEAIAVNNFNNLGLPVPPNANNASTVYNSDSRDNRSYYTYLGVQHDFLENLRGSVKLGVQYTTYYNDPSATSSLGPYADASLIYTYASGSYMQLGLTQTRNETDTVQINSNGQITQDQESTVVYGSINHMLTPKLIASLVGHFQYSIYNQGQYNSQTSEFYNAGANLSYAFTRHFSSDIGYNFDWYTTAVPGQGYTRNRVYLGVTATY